MKPRKQAPAAKEPSGKVKREAAAIPVDADRLRKQFPALTEAELAAYVTVTRSIMTAANRAALLKTVMERGRTAQDRTKRGEALDANEALASNYLAAIGKMQRSTTSRSTH